MKKTTSKLFALVKNITSDEQPKTEEDKKLADNVSTASSQNDGEKTLDKLEEILKNVIVMDFFMRYLERESQLENILFIQQVKEFELKFAEYKKEKSGAVTKEDKDKIKSQWDKVLKEKAVEIYERFLMAEADLALTLSPQAREPINKAIKLNKYKRVFDAAKLEIAKLLVNELYPSFQKSDLYDEATGQKIRRPSYDPRQKEFESDFRVHAVLLDYIDSKGNVKYHDPEFIKVMEKYTKDLGHFDFAKLSTPNDKQAFWINAYNMISLYKMALKLQKNPHFKGNTNPVDRFRFFMYEKVTVCSRSMTLNEILKILQATKDPRIHFALQNSARSGPKLKVGLFSGERLDKELEEVTKSCLQSDDFVKYEEQKGYLTLNPVFKIYLQDFVNQKSNNSEELVMFIVRYCQDQVASALKDRLYKNFAIKVKYFDWDWKLNITTTEDANISSL